MSAIENRKKQHINLAKNPDSQISNAPFADFKLKHRALPEMDYEQVDTSTTLFRKKLNQPLIIASMTGGTTHADTINTNLAIAVEETGVAMGVGSQRIALEIKEAEKSFKLARKNAPTAVIFANMGAVQLNYGRKIEDYQSVVDMLEADGLYLHLNALQEAIQPEGDTNFADLLKKIKKVVKKVSVPVFAKEVGHGFDYKTAKNLLEVGIIGIDVAGANGTSWAWIEAKRKGSENLAKWFKDFGISTEKSLENSVKARNAFTKKSQNTEKPVAKNKIKLVASGGIRSPIEGLKAHKLGANYYSAAKPFLKPALKNPETLIKVIKEWEKGLKTAMFCTETKNW